MSYTFQHPVPSRSDNTSRRKPWTQTSATLPALRLQPDFCDFCPTFKESTVIPAHTPSIRRLHQYAKDRHIHIQQALRNSFTSTIDTHRPALHPLCSSLPVSVGTCLHAVNGCSHREDRIPLSPWTNMHNRYWRRLLLRHIYESNSMSRRMQKAVHRQRNLLTDHRI